MYVVLVLACQGNKPTHDVSYIQCIPSIYIYGYIFVIFPINRPTCPLKVHARYFILLRYGALERCTKQDTQDNLRKIADMIAALVVHRLDASRKGPQQTSSAGDGKKVCPARSINTITTPYTRSKKAVYVMASGRGAHRTLF